MTVPSENLLRAWLSNELESAYNAKGLGAVENYRQHMATAAHIAAVLPWLALEPETSTTKPEWAKPGTPLDAMSHNQLLAEAKVMLNKLELMNNLTRNHQTREKRYREALSAIEQIASEEGHI